MASDNPPSLLSLTGEVAEILLSFVGSGKGGTQALLNLRHTCKTTQRWVDNLPHRQGKRIFSRSQIKVDLSPQTLQRFLAFPPPFPVTALSLLNAEYLRTHSFSFGEEFEWDNFTDIWTPKLESLEVDSLCVPLGQRIAGNVELFSCPTIRSFRVNNIWLRQLVARPFELPEFMTRLEELSINRLLITDEQKLSFYRLMSTNQNLKRLEMNLSEEDELEGLTNLIDAKKNDANFHLTFRLVTTNLDLEEDEVYRRFVVSVALSLSTIRLLEVSEVEILGLWETFGEVAARKFLSCVESISSLSEFTADGEFFGLVDLTNLKRLKEVSIKPENLEGTRFPESLLQLGISTDVLFPPPQIFPRNLTHLNLTGFNVTASEFLRSLTCLGERCPQLASLSFHWTCAYSGLLQNCDFLQTPSFSNLKSLTFKMTFYSDDDVLNCRWILLHGLRVNCLKLRTLNMFLRKNGDQGILYVLDATILKAFIEGPVGQTLTEVELNEWPEEEDTATLVTKLKTRASENEVTRHETEGWQREESFSPDSRGRSSETNLRGEERRREVGVIAGLFGM